MLDECYSGIPRTPAGGLVLGDGSPRIPASTLYTLRPTQAFPPSVMCTAVARRVSRVSVSFRARLWAVYLRYLLCFASGLATLYKGIPACCLAFEIPISKMLPLPFIL